MEMEKLVSLCKRRGFLFQSSEIYGGLNGFWDYGPLGVELKRNVKEAWWRDMVSGHDDIATLPGRAVRERAVQRDDNLLDNIQKWSDNHRQMIQPTFLEDPYHDSRRPF